MAIECLILGAGQEVGKSCVVVTINGKRIMFDCGMHMGHQDEHRYPEFSLICKSDDDFTNSLSCIIITHFHLDHIGALPYFTQVRGYNGPIYMTYPTKALAPLMLEDYRKVMVDRRGEVEQFSSEDIIECMKKVTAVDLKQTIQVDKDLQIRAYYAGHVLGAAMFYAKVGDAAMVYTGDYNMTPDRHLGAAQIDRLQLDLVITESTYATTYRDSKYVREREFLKAVHKCVVGGGKVLIPTFALGRAQELCMLLEDYWERMNLKVPIYFSSGLTIQANFYYKVLINWTSQKVKDSYATRNPFDFKNVSSFARSLINAPGPCVLFATPGMISGGFSLEVFKEWAPYEGNLVALPGYCVAGTVGHKLMSAKTPTQIRLDKDVQIDVRCEIHQLSFSPHTDAKGITDLVKFLSPKHVILVHGEKPKMSTLKEKIESQLAIKCYYPSNTETVSIPSTQHVPADASDEFLRSCLSPNFNFPETNFGRGFDLDDESHKITLPMVQVCDDRVAQGMLTLKDQKPKVVKVGRLIDAYLAEIAPDPYLNLAKFVTMIEVLPDYARVIDDGLYRAIDIYLKAHPTLNEQECKRLCTLVDCEKLSQEACNHVAQNDRLPVHMVVRVLYFEQVRLKNAMSVGDGLLSQKMMMSSNSAPMSPRDTYASLRRENRELRLEISRMRVRLSDLEKEQAVIKQGMMDKSRQGKTLFTSISRRIGMFKGHEHQHKRG